MSKHDLPRPKAYSYLRFSTPDQMKGDSFRRQLKRTKEYAEKNGLELDESLNLQDLGVSAYRGKNVEEGRLGEFLRAVDEGHVKIGSYLLVENLDRLSRQDPYTAFTQFSTILKKGIHIVTVGDGKMFSADNMDFSDLMLAVVGMQRAHEESLTKSRRQLAAWEGKREKAKAGKVKFTARCPAWLELDKETQAFTEIPERVAVVRRIFSMVLEGHGKRTITRTFNEEGVLTFGRSQGWQDSYIQKITQNEAVIGYYQPHHMKDVEGKRKRIPVGDPIEDYFPAIIDKGTFYKARGLRNAKAIPTGRVAEHFSNLFTGLAYCGHCGAPMHFENKGKPPRGNTYLVCSAARRKVDGCQRHSWSYPKTQAHIILNLTELNYTELFPSVYQRSKSTTAHLEEAILVAEAELEKVIEAQDKLVDQLIDRPDSTAIKRRLEALESDERVTKDRLQNLQTDLEKEKDTLAYAQESYNQLSSAMKRYMELEQAQKPSVEEERLDARRLLHQHLKRVVSKITLTPAHSKESAYHGIIEIAFNGADYIKRIKVEAGQAQSKGYRVEDGIETPSVYISDAQWPPVDRILGPAALWDILTMED